MSQNQDVEKESWLKEHSSALLTAVSGIFMILSFFHVHWIIPYISIAAGAVPASASAFEAIKERQLDVNILMLLAAIGSIGLGLPVEAAILLFLFALSGTLEEFALGRTKSAIEALIKLRPEKAIKVDGDHDTEVLVKDLKVGDRFRVLAFQNVPADGVIIEGQTSVNESAMTGESMPVDKVPGDKILAGTQNQESMIVAEVTVEAGDTALEKIVELVRDAQENQASGERISVWFGSKYTYFVIAVFVISLVIRMALGEGINRSLYASLTVFVALSPCAVVIASPAATLSALAWAARNGILIRGGQYVEAAGLAQNIAMDKTGTLTNGRPVLAKICACYNVEGNTCKDEEGCWTGEGMLPTRSTELLRLAAGVEQFSTHPIADAIVQAAKIRNIPVPHVENATTFPGMGVEAVIDGKLVQVGQRKFFETDGRHLPTDFLEHVIEHQEEGYTVAIVKADHEYAALAMGDQIRPEASKILSKLRDLGMKKIVMLTGDTQQTAQTVAEELGITELRAGLLPADKEETIAHLASSGGVIMVGDGVNDAPSLARADLGVAMGGLGSDVALSAAQAVLMKDSLEGLPKLISLGKMTNTVIKQSLFFAIGIVITLFVGTILADAFLSPEARKAILPIAVLGHEGSTVLVILNGLRLLAGPKVS